MSAVRLLHHIHGQKTESIDALLIELGSHAGIGRNGEEKSDALSGLALFVSATALRAFRTQLVGLAAMVAAILPGFRHLALAGAVRAFVIDLHAEVASLNRCGSSPPDVHDAMLAVFMK
jgi:hypothetical protein